MNKGELKVILDNHEKWLRSEMGGVRADLSNADLRHADLRYADLSNADLRYADLRYADLEFADLRYADLEFADLSNADLEFADLRYADLSNADLSNADLRYADLSNADLDFSQLNLSCKGLDFKIDERIAKQIAYHLVNLMQHSDLNVNEIFKKETYKWLETSHLITEYYMPVLKNKEKENE